MAKAKETVDPIDLATQAINEGINEWLAEFDAEKTKKEALAILNRKKEMLTLKLLGFSDRWGKWEVDSSHRHSNEIGEQLNRVAQEAINEWIPTLKHTLNPETTRGKAIIKAATEEYYARLARLLHSYFHVQAEEDAKAIFAQLDNMTLADKIIATRKLLQQT